MCGSVREGNMVSIVQSLVVNGTAGEISPLSPEEHLRTEHQRGFSSLCQATVPPNHLCYSDSAVCGTKGRGNEREKRRGEREENISIERFLQLSPPFCYFFFHSAFSLSPRGIAIPLSISLSVSITSPSSPSLPHLCSFFLSSSHPHSNLSLISREGWYSSSRHTN